MNNAVEIAMIVSIFCCPIFSLLFCLRLIINGHAKSGFLAALFIVIGFWVCIEVVGDRDFYSIAKIEIVYYSFLLLGTNFYCLAKLMSKK